jgi:hypothetical protein
VFGFLLGLIPAQAAPPRIDAILSPTPGATNVSVPPTLAVTVSDPDTSKLSVTFYGRLALTNAPGPDFTIVVLPDTQFYSASYPATYQAQVDWIIANRTNLNIVYVAHVGDIVDGGDTLPAQWLNATNAMYRLESPVRTGLPGGIPYGVVPGNHDHTGGTTLYNTYFGAAHFAGRSYYGGNLGGNNQSHYDLFSAGGLNFIALFADFSSTAGEVNYTTVDAWANSVLATNADRRAIVVSHCILAANGSYDGSRSPSIYADLKGNTNLFLMFCGHNTGEALRTETYQGRTVNICLSDYQGLANGGNGWLRTYQFSPSNNVIHVKTYSPTLLQYDTDAGSQFDLAYSMTNSPAPWQTVAVVTNVPSGSTASAVWSNLPPATACEWYVAVSDGAQATNGPVCSFTTTRVGSRPNVLGISVPAGGPATIRFTGFTGFAYNIEASTNLLDWRNIGQVTAATNGLIQFSDPDTPKYPVRFYRSP